MCGKRLKAVLPSLMESLETHGHLVADSELRRLLIQISLGDHLKSGQL